MGPLIVPYSDQITQIAWWNDAFTDEELNWLQSKARNEGSAAQVGGGGKGEYRPEIRRSQISWLHPTEENMWVFNRIGHVVSNLNARFFKFDLTCFGESIQLTHYDQSEHGMYGWHQDYGSIGPSRKLSVVLQLSDPSEYEGGNLELMTSARPEAVQKKRGFIVVFPSFVLHQVTPVTHGNRQSLVSWITGPSFK